MKTNKRVLLALMTGIYLAVSAFVPSRITNSDKPIPWKIDPAHSNISFTVTHFFTPVTGKFNEYTSVILFDPENLTESRINIDIMVNSIDTNNDRRNNHLKSEDFFNAGQFPKMSFISDKISSEGDNKFIAHGTLTIKNVTKNIELPFTLLGIKEHPMRPGTQIAGIKADYRLDRTDYTVGVGDWAATAVVGDQVDISIALELDSSGS